MDLKKIKNNKIEVALLLIVILQVLLLVNMVTANSYIIYQTGTLTENSKIINREKNNFKDLINSGINLLIGFLSIKQIGIVSAQEDIVVEEWCCPNTCDPIYLVDGELDGECPGSVDPIPTSCDAVPDCILGCCFDPEQGLCSTDSPHGTCISGGGEWHDNKDCEPSAVPECRKGCCVLGSNCKFRTETHCAYLEGEFNQIWNEPDCLALCATQVEGACILQGTCSRKTEAGCLSDGGMPYPNYLCSHLDLNTGCEKQDYVDCVEGKDEIYWFDSCGNRENIYSSGSDLVEDYGMVLSKSESCDDANGNINSQTCGNCYRPLSTCSKTGAGDFICKDLSCIDAPANVGTKDRINTEKWCLYDGYIGKVETSDGRTFAGDVVGSEHWLAYCNDGEVEIDPCDSPYRGEICAERTTEENGKSFTHAFCAPNQATECINYNPEIDEDMSEEEIEDAMEEMNESCNANKHCMAKHIEVDEYFKFDMCVPRYPKGDDLTDEIDGNLCSIASRSCSVYYRKNAIGRWICQENCECETDEFAKQMNDLCISLGDCGSYINYIGDETNNTEIEGKKGKKIDSEGKETDKESECTGLKEDKGIKKRCEDMAIPTISLTDYQSYTTPVQDQHVEPQDIDEFLSSLGGSGGDFGPADYTNVFLVFGGISGGLGALAMAVSYVSNVFLPTTGVFTTYASTFYTTAGGIGGVIGGFATVLTAMAIGVIGAAFLAKALGRSGAAAIAMMVSGGVAGLMVGLAIAGVEVPLIGWIAAGVAVLFLFWIIITGWGQGETRIVEFTCQSWQAPTFDNYADAQDNCEKCNVDPSRPCTKYRCSSLGQTCRILNEDEENPSCDSLEYEPNPPVISAGEILTGGYDFDPDDFQDKRIEIISTTDGCIQEFTSLLFTLHTDEPAQCKYSFEIPPSSYQEMDNNYPSGQNTFTKNHTFSISMPTLDSPDVYDIIGTLKEMSGSLNMYVRCQDYWENPNIDEYIVKFCITREDKTAVNHGLTIANPANGATLKYGTNETDLTIWVNEPADCRYDSVAGKDYESMKEMECRERLTLTRPDFRGWPCEKDDLNISSGKNEFYIKCKDKPWVVTDEDIAEYGERNVNEDDYPYTIYVSQNELKIDSVSFRTTVSDKKITIFPGETFSVGGVQSISVDMEVKTSGGIDNGKSECKWGVLENGNRWQFYDTFSNIHKQVLTPRFSGTHINYIECKDDAENEANMTAQFKISIDDSSPIVVRVYKDGGSLKLKTNEDAKCYYSFENCNFGFDDEDAFGMTTGFSTEHSAKWNSGQTYSIVCVDYWGNKGCKKVIPSSY